MARGSPYHVIIAVLQRDCAVKVREEDELRVLERPLHGLQVAVLSHYGVDLVAEIGSRVGNARRECGRSSLTTLYWGLECCVLHCMKNKKLGESRPLVGKMQK